MRWAECSVGQIVRLERESYGLTGVGSLMRIIRAHPGNRESGIVSVQYLTSDNGDDEYGYCNEQEGSEDTLSVYVRALTPVM